MMMTPGAFGFRAGAVALAWSLALASRAPSPRQAPERTTTLAVREAQLSPDGTAVVFTIGAADSTPGGTTAATLWRVPFAGGDPVRLGADDGEIAHPRWSPDGRRVAFLYRPRPGEPARIRLLPENGGVAEWATEPRVDISIFEWSPDGLSYAYVGRTPADPTSRLWVRDRAMATARRLGDAESITSIGWSPSGRSIAIVGRTSGSMMRVLAVPLSGPARQIAPEVGRASSVAFSPDGTLIAWVSEDIGSPEVGHARFASALGGPVQTVSLPAGPSVRGASWAAASRLSIVLEGNGERHVDVIDLTAGTRTVVLPPGVANIVAAPSWSADGRRFVVVGSTPEDPAEAYAGLLPQPYPRGSDTAGAPPPPVRRITFSNR
jgi:Tol biopolymer transport system component